MTAAPSAAASQAPRSWLARTVIALYNDRRVRYLAVGGVSAVSYYGFYTALYLLTSDDFYGQVYFLTPDQMHYLVPTVIANFLCGVVTYPLQRYFVFQSKGPVLSGFFKFYLICLWALLFTWLGLPLLVEVFNVPVLIAQAILIVVAPLINYQLSKLWAFRR
ncbi:GtrA family protein [Dactylosporangium sp. NPDC005555]|uniref:GtrA family protein n=1 Tax=Dactylosporangium sp. NPDC005555 TaxID=3154889 RepID=UPI0033BF61E3